MNNQMTRTVVTDVPVINVLSQRWSPRAFDPTVGVSASQLHAVLEAARWAPSSANSQPWRFIVGRRGDPTYQALFDALMEGNQLWAGQAPVLVLAVAQTSNGSGREFSHGQYDLGQAVAHLSIQAHAEGLAVHQMGGFRAEQVREHFGIASDYVPMVVLALGRAGDADGLPEPLRTRERGPRVRRPLAEIAFSRAWEAPVEL